MKDFLEGLVQKALDQGASYADARRVRRKTEYIFVRDGKLEQVSWKKQKVTTLGCW